MTYAEDWYMGYLDDSHEVINIGGLEYGAGHVLHAVDPIAFRVGLGDTLDAMADDFREEVRDIWAREIDACVNAEYFTEEEAETHILAWFDEALADEDSWEDFFGEGGFDAKFWFYRFVEDCKVKLNRD